MFAHERALKEERMQAREAMKVVLDKMGRGESLSVEDRTALDAANVRISEIEAELRSIDTARALSAATDVPEAPQADAGEARERDFSAYLKRGTVSPELRAAGEATNSAGGYLVPPGWWQRLQVALKAFGGIANDFEQMTTDSGQPMQWATVDPTTTIGTLIGENTQISDVDYTFGQGVLNAYMYTSGVQKVSFQLANDSAFDLDSFVAARVGESLGRAAARAAVDLSTYGTGVSMPLSITKALDGKGSAGTVGGAIAQTGGFVTLSAARSASLWGSSTTELVGNFLTPSTLQAMVAAVDPAYRALGAKWYMNDAQQLALRALVDSNGRPLINLIDGISDDQPITRLLGYPIVMDPSIPNLTASTTGGPVFGHLQSAMVRRTVSQSGLLRLSERYADFLQVGFIGYMRFDTRSNDLRAAVCVKPAAT